MVLYSCRVGRLNFWTSDSHMNISVLPVFMRTLPFFPFIYFLIGGSCCKQTCKQCRHYHRIRRMMSRETPGMMYFNKTADFITFSTRGVPSWTVTLRMPIVATKETLLDFRNCSCCYVSIRVAGLSLSCTKDCLRESE